MFLFIAINFKSGCNINELTALDEHSHAYSKLAAKTIKKVKILRAPFSESKNVRKALRKYQSVDTQP